ncbi:MAG TPA: hypothetical protein VFA78_09645 [Chloroflexota bacterium]|nr:hypothetical protein [Chloroflexota bacterium]
MVSEQSEAGGFQAGGRAWDPARPDIERLLAISTCTRLRPIYYGSNHCFLVTLDAGDEGESFAVYKPRSGEYPLYDFPHGTLYRREICSYLVDKILGWSLVPPTVRADFDYGAGSVQLFIEEAEHETVSVAELRRLALLDILINNADRKVDHCLVDGAGKVWGIDHGLTFNVQPKLRTVLWHFAGSEIPADEADDVRRLSQCLQRPHSDAERIRELISPAEWKALRERVDRIGEYRRFPDPRYKPVPYRW